MNNRLLQLIRLAFRTQYRLSVLCHGDNWYSDTYSTDGRLLRRMARHIEADNWIIYKRGPFGLPEREVESGKQCALRFTRREKCVHHPGRRKTKGYGQ